MAKNFQIKIGEFKLADENKKITGTAYSVRELLARGRYGLDFYQREYSWGETQVVELIHDLAGRFLDEYEPVKKREEILLYRPYFLGPIVTEQRSGVTFLVDGQQRLTTLTLLLIYLRRSLAEKYADDANELGALIFSRAVGRKTFYLDVDEREDCLKAILDGTEFDANPNSDSVRNLWNQYETINYQFPNDLDSDLLPYFCDWLQHRVFFVDIGAPDQEMALEIFETMNDRGLRLSNTDMLKSFLISKVGNEQKIWDLNESWKKRVTLLNDTEENAAAEFIKAWLRANYAKTRRERKANATPGDFDKIHTAFHKWVRDNVDTIGLKNEMDYLRFVEHEFFEYSSRYCQVINATKEFNPEFKSVYHISLCNFTLQFLVIMAAITPNDNDEIFATKANLVASALDIFVSRRIVNFRNFGYNTVVDTIFSLVKRIRNRSVDDIREILSKWLKEEDERFDGIVRHPFYLTKRNNRHVFYLLARITAWLDQELGTGITIVNYFDKTTRDPFQVEHIIANKFEDHDHNLEYESENEFEDYRNRFGAMLLLPRSFNASFGDMPYQEKLKHYYAQNPLARSLHPLAYQNNPRFVQLCESQNLLFEPYPATFARAEIQKRQELYKSLAEIVWDPASHGL